jgi:hypothetical protein
VGHFGFLFLEHSCSIFSGGCSVEEKRVTYVRRRLDITTEKAERVVNTLSAGWKTRRVADMATELKLSPTTVRSIARRLGLGERPERGSQSDPSRLEILFRAGEIRKGWSPEEKAKRDLLRRSPKTAEWEAPTVSIGRIEAPSFSRM